MLGQLACSVVFIKYRHLGSAGAMFTVQPDTTSMLQTSTEHFQADQSRVFHLANHKQLLSLDIYYFMKLVLIGEIIASAEDILDEPTEEPVSR